jgi:hypothetical protein
MRNHYFIPALLFAGLAAAEPSIPRVLGPRIGSIYLGLTRSQVEAELGKPERVVSTGGALDPEIRYPGLTIWLRNNENVMQLRSTNPRHCLPGNVCPGSTAASVLASIGQPQEGAALRAGINTYPVIFRNEEHCWAEITLENNLVSVVEIKCRASAGSR